ncbi:hypothetical protein ACO2Q8_02585 [Larkinella sp. VNQ87]|uniref:hypothetical protein n=1 Tax=Larkinella sp. VNQ87 TaxID=3400921 RepID=UPI003C0529E5
MKYIPLFGFALALTTTLSFAQKTAPVKSAWTTATSFADSAARNASGEVYLEGAKVHATATNNAEKLFLTLQLDDDQDQFKALLFGSTIWLDQKGKRKAWKGIQFPLPEEMDPATGRPLSMGPKTGPTDRGMMMKHLLSRKIEMKLIRLVAEDDMLVSATGDPSGISARLEEKAGRLVYQLVVPLALIGGKPGAEAPLSISFESGVPERPKQTSSDAGSMSGMGGMGGMYGRRGMYGGGGGFSGPTIAPTRFGLTVQLAGQ